LHPAKLEDYRSYVSEEGALVLMSGWTGLDFSKHGPDEPILHSRQDAQTSALEAFTIADPDRVWTVREIAKHAAVGGRGRRARVLDLKNPENWRTTAARARSGT
jgi:hypothetical protein